jgi:hypothetical protein
MNAKIVSNYAQLKFGLDAERIMITLKDGYRFIMPTLLNFQGFRFFFYSNENDEPIHIHVEKAEAEGKIWLEPAVRVAYLHRFSSREEKQIMEIVIANFEMFKDKWNEYFA